MRVAVLINDRVKTLSEGQSREFHRPGEGVKFIRERVLSIQHNLVDRKLGTVVKENPKTYIVKLDCGSIIKRKKEHCEVLESGTI